MQHDFVVARWERKPNGQQIGHHQHYGDIETGTLAA